MLTHKNSNKDRCGIYFSQGIFQLILACFLSVVICSQSHRALASDLIAEFQSALDAFQSQYGFPGATAAFVLPDGTVGITATGFADLEAGTPMTPQSRMLAASIGKTFVGATTVVLCREGVLNLDAHISRWLGDRRWFPRLPNHDTITLRHLLTHTSGLPDHVHQKSFAIAVSQKWREIDNPFPPESLIQFILDQPPLFNAGKAWAYTDTGYILIGLIIEQATGRSYFDEINERFLIPLGLTQTSPSDKRILPGLAAGYLAVDNSFGFPGKTTTTEGIMVWHPGIEWTGGGLVSTSRDLALWAAALFEGKAIKGDYLGELLLSVPMSPDTADMQYAAGVSVLLSGPFGPVYGHGGWIPGYSSSLRYYPEHRVAVAFQINTDIGLMDGAIPAIRSMETRLAEIAISATRTFKHNCCSSLP